jgi:Mg2+/Co2+ transporter CorB
LRAEIALISCDKVKMKLLADRGSNSAKLVMNAFSEIDRFISTTLVGINLSLITSTIIMTFYIHHRFGAGKEYYTVLILSPLIIIFGQVVPRRCPEKRNTIILGRYTLWFASKVFY